MKPVKNIFVVVPVYNENIRAIETLKKILSVFKGYVIVVNDGSNDNTKILLNKHFKKNQKIIIRHINVNKGKGSALKVGVKLAWEMGGEAVIFIDADGQHNPKYLKKIIELLQKNEIVFGYRILSKKMPFLRRLGNIIAVHLVRILFNIKKKDLLCGYLGFRKEIYKKIEWNSDRYGIETEMATRIGKQKLKFSEIKIDTIYIDKYKGVTLIDAIKVLMQIPYWYLEK